MLYCENCADWHGWPQTLTVLAGRREGLCEVCGKAASCFDKPLNYLPRPARLAPGGMHWQEFYMHLRAGVAAGEDRTCGTKKRHDTLPEAEGHARSLNQRPRQRAGRNNTVQEAYPCPWGVHWHVGRQMTPEERERYGAE